MNRASSRRILVVATTPGCLLFSLAINRTTAAAQKPQKIKIYFYHEPGEYIDLSPVTRTIRSVSPARAAIQGLLKGPTAAERKNGFEGLAGASEFSIGSLTIQNGTARINFVVLRESPRSGRLKVMVLRDLHSAVRFTDSTNQCRLIPPMNRWAIIIRQLRRLLPQSSTETLRSTEAQRKRNYDVISIFPSPTPNTPEKL